MAHARQQSASRYRPTLLASYSQIVWDTSHCKHKKYERSGGQTERKLSMAPAVPAFSLFDVNLKVLGAASHRSLLLCTPSALLCTPSAFLDVNHTGPHSRHKQTKSEVSSRGKDGPRATPPRNLPEVRLFVSRRRMCGSQSLFFFSGVFGRAK